MKKIYILIALIVFTASSCKKSFLGLAPEDTYTDVTFYKTEEQFKQAVIAAYAPLRDVLTNDFYTSEMRSDNTIYEPIPNNRGSAYVQKENISDFMDNSINPYTNAVWEHCYKGISRANIVIERLVTSSLSAAAKTPLDGQAKFLRALNYFKLVRLYGGVPLFLTEVTTAEGAFLPRSSVEQVYAQIILDANDAINELAPPTSFPQTGAATKGAATVLLAEVYVTQKKWAEAEALLNTLPAMGYALNANYADAFSITNKNSKESIFEVQYLQGTAVGTSPNPLPLFWLPRTTSTTIITGNASNNSTTGGFNTPTQDLINSYEANDKRLDASIGIVEGSYSPSYIFTYSANKSVINYVPAAGKIGVPYIKKLLHTPLAAVNNTNDNFPIYRYADALLLLAEAQNEQGKSPLTALNVVRNRAGLPATTETSQALLRDIILHERRIELAFENDRWHDLVRTGKAVAVMGAFGTQLKTQVSYLPAGAYNVTTNRILFPIPIAEVELNSAMVQNPGY